LRDPETGIRVSPLGTAFRGFLRADGKQFVHRLITYLQLLTVLAVVAALRHGLPSMIAVALLLDVILVAVLLRYRSGLDRWRERAWAYSERSRWL
jgi:hypothetical protein